MGKRGCPGQTAGNLTSAALFASCHDGGVQAVTKIFGHLINFVAAIDLDRFLSGVEDDFAVAAFLEVQLNFSAGLGGNRVVDQIVEDCKKLGAGHDAASTTEGILSGKTELDLGRKEFTSIVRLGLILRASIRWRPILWTPLSF
jgi:hypothetical protein